jgi:carbonic anhydrase
MHGLLDPTGLDKLPAVARWIEHSRAVLAKVGEGSEADRLMRAIEHNVLLQLEHLRTHPAVQAALDARALRMHGWVYDFEQGQVRVYDPMRGQFVPLVESLRQKMLADAAADNQPRSDWQTRA